MRLVHRGVLSDFLRILSYALVGALILFILVDLMDHMGSFLDNQATLSMVLRYYLYKAVWILDTVLPIAMLLATLFTIGAMARYNELTALFAAGHSLLQVARPLVVFAVVTAILSLAWREYVLPRANTARTRIWEVQIHKRPERIRPTNDIVLTGQDGRLYYARAFNARTGSISGFRVVTTANAQVTERMDAQKADWQGDRWLLRDGTWRVFQDGQETVTAFKQLPAPHLAVTPEDFDRERIDPEDMNISQLRHHIVLVRRSGGDPTASRVDIQFMLAFPVVHVIVVFLGVLLASGPRKTTVAAGFGLTVLISFGYYLCMNFGRALGHNGVLPPVAAGWGGNVLYAVIGWLLYQRARR
jgi:lipopolysaccharide export system permease protein